MVAGKTVRAGRAFVELTLRDFVSAGLKAVQAKLKAFAAGVRAAGMAMMKLGAMIVAPLAIAGVAFAKMGDQMQKMSARTGVSVEELSRLAHAIQISGGSVEDLEKGFKGLARFVTDAGAGLSTQTRALKVLGLGFKDLKGMKPEDQFKLIADRLSTLDDDTLRTGTALTIFGRAGMKMMPMLKAGAKGIKALGDEADAMGHTMSTEDAEAAAILTDEMTKLWNTIKMTVFHIGAGLAPAMTKASTKLREWGVVAMEWIKKNRDMIMIVAKVALGLIALGLALMIVSPAISLAAAAVGVLAFAVGVLQGVLAFLMTPLGFIVGAMVFLAHATGNLGNITKDAAGVVKGAWGGIKGAALSAFGGVTDALMSGEWKLAAQIAWLGIKSAWTSGIKPLREAWVGFKGWWQQSVLNLGSWFKKSWSSSMGVMQQGLTVIKSKFMDEHPAVLAARLDAGRRGTADKNKQIDKDAAARKDEINAEVAAEMEAIGADERTKRAALDTARKLAADKRAIHKSTLEEESKGLKVPDLPDLPDIDDMPGWAGMGEAAKKIAASGAFSSAAVARMGGGIKTPEEETAKNTEKTVEVLEKVETTLHNMNVSGAISFQ